VANVIDEILQGSLCLAVWRDFGMNCSRKGALRGSSTRASQPSVVPQRENFGNGCYSSPWLSKHRVIANPSKSFRSFPHVQHSRAILTAHGETTRPFAMMAISIDRNKFQYWNTSQKDFRIY